MQGFVTLLTTVFSVTGVLATALTLDVSGRPGPLNLPPLNRLVLKDGAWVEVPEPPTIRERLSDAVDSLDLPEVYELFGLKVHKPQSTASASPDASGR